MAKKEVRNCTTCKYWDKVTKYCKSTLSDMYGEYMYDGKEGCSVQFMIYKNSKKKKKKKDSANNEKQKKFVIVEQDNNNDYPES